MFFCPLIIFLFGNQFLVKMIVVLVGYMGSGKSTIGKELANTLNYTFIDLDSYIETQEGFTIQEIFNSKGEIYFRKQESSYLGHILNNYDRLVLSLGGGTPCYSNNMQSVTNSKNIASFYLDTSIGVLAKRLMKEKNERPLLKHVNTEEDMLEFIGKHLFERRPFYAKSLYGIKTDHKTIDQTVESIVLKLF